VPRLVVLATDQSVNTVVGSQAEPAPASGGNELLLLSGQLCLVPPDSQSAALCITPGPAGSYSVRLDREGQVYLFKKLSRLLTWLSIRLAIATVAAISAAGFGLLAVPSAHAGLDPTAVQVEHSAPNPLHSR
jgi:hypothetical protein